MKLLIKYWYIIAIAILAVLLIIECQEDVPKTVTTTVIEYVTKTDTIIKTVISKPKKVYITKIKRTKGIDSIIYVDRKAKEAIEVNQYDTTIKSNNATADLQITTTGELLDVQGVITWKEKITTVEVTKTINASGLFIYMGTSLNPTFDKIELGLDYQIRNKFLIGASVDYNNFTQNVNLNLKIGIKIF